MEKAIVYIDMDGVIVDFMSGVKKLTKEELNTRPGHPEDVEGVFSKMEPLGNSVEAVTKLIDSGRYEVYILSTAPWKNPSAWTDKVNWIHKYFGDKLKKHIILSHHKDLNNLNAAGRECYLIDDAVDDKHGAKQFGDHLLYFGEKGDYKNWDAVLAKLLG